MECVEVDGVDCRVVSYVRRVVCPKGMRRGLAQGEIWCASQVSSCPVRIVDRRADLHFIKLFFSSKQHQTTLNPQSHTDTERERYPTPPGSFQCNKMTTATRSTSWRVPHHLPTIPTTISSLLFWGPLSKPYTQTYTPLTTPPPFTLRLRPIKPLTAPPAPLSTGSLILRSFLYARKHWPGTAFRNVAAQALEQVNEAWRRDGLPRLVFAVSMEVERPLRGKILSCIRHRFKRRAKVAMRLALEELRKEDPGTVPSHHILLSMSPSLRSHPLTVLEMFSHTIVSYPTSCFLPRPNDTVRFSYPQKTDNSLPLRPRHLPNDPTPPHLPPLPHPNKRTQIRPPKNKPLPRQKGVSKCPRVTRVFNTSGSTEGESSCVGAVGEGSPCGGRHHEHGGYEHGGHKHGG